MRKKLDTTFGDVELQTTAASMVGGTASVIAGGKFANGAYSAAFGYLFDQVASGRAQKVQRPEFYTFNEDGLLVSYEPTAAQLANFDSAMAELAGAGRLGGAFVNAFHSEGIGVIHTQGIPNQFDNFISLNLDEASFVSNSALGTAASEWGISLSAARAQIGSGANVIAHELGHRFLNFTNMGFPKSDFVNVGVAENSYIRPALGLPARTHYGNLPVPSVDPNTSNELRAL
ncbi:hypothetical protein [Cerasicoccus frondis]|uniref:hypothetical protein n=1 Tax=Cerasicoccus frondis TaxID=490090 RepID=UPI0028527754|nr:hypothetical protein [Cerasicoccus frondis]